MISKAHSNRISSQDAFMAGFNSDGASWKDTSQNPLLLCFKPIFETQCLDPLHFARATFEWHVSIRFVSSYRLLFDTWHSCTAAQICMECVFITRNPPSLITSKLAQIPAMCNLFSAFSCLIWWFNLDVCCLLLGWCAPQFPPSSFERLWRYGGAEPYRFNKTFYPITHDYWAQTRRA